MSRGSVLEARFICHRAANAIVTQVDPLRVSTDALQIINQFLDEFLTLLLSSAQSLDLSRIKSGVYALLPTSNLGKNAIVEAELQVKSYTEVAETIDYEAYERTRSLATLDAHIIDQLRQGCVDYCTLAEKNHQINNPTRRPLFSERISPIVTVYVTSILEHLAEYVLTAVAMTAEVHNTEYIRIKEVYQAFVDDAQICSLFNRMELKTRLEKRTSHQRQSLHYTQQQQQMGARQSTVLPMNPRSSFKNRQYRESGRIDPYFDAIATSTSDANDMTDTDFDHHRQSPLQRPISIMTTSTSTNTISSTASSSSSNGHKKGFRLFKKRDSTGSNGNQQSAGPAIAVYNPDSPSALNFEDLIRSGDTVRVSLTPSRLKSIEINGPAFSEESIVECDITPFENPRQAPKPPSRRPTSFPDEQQHKQQTPPPIPSPSSPPTPSSPQYPARRQPSRVQPIERPSSMAVKRASMIGTHPRPLSFHENVLIAGNTLGTITGAGVSGIVKDKILKFETPSPAATRHLTFIPPQPQPQPQPQSPPQPQPPQRTTVTCDASVQTELCVGRPTLSSSSSSSRSSTSSSNRRRCSCRNSGADSNAGERGVIVGDEEWFVAEDDWEDEQTVAEWLLGG
ncbi:hypothetical protein BX666DRAFT_1994418 [Dichotomocladium elegans]|nr:hypothetical protein BX666DRAFT_1994418 [Dichotomocladium elegans]